MINRTKGLVHNYASRVTRKIISKVSNSFNFRAIQTIQHDDLSTKIVPFSLYSNLKTKDPIQNTDALTVQYFTSQSPQRTKGNSGPGFLNYVRTAGLAIRNTYHHSEVI